MTERSAEEQEQKYWEALKKYGIHTEAQLNKAIEELEPLNISCMVSPVKKEEKDDSTLLSKE